MFFKMIARNADEENVWTERYDTLSDHFKQSRYGECATAEDYGAEVIAFWNDTLRPHEKARVFVSARAISEEEFLDDTFRADTDHKTEYVSLEERAILAFAKEYDMPVEEVREIWNEDESEEIDVSPFGDQYNDPEWIHQQMQRVRETFSNPATTRRTYDTLQRGLIELEVKVNGKYRMMVSSLKLEAKMRREHFEESIWEAPKTDEEREMSELARLGVL